MSELKELNVNEAAEAAGGAGPVPVMYYSAFGDSLQYVAAQFCVSVDSIKALNPNYNFVNDYIQPGWRIIVKYVQTY